MQMNVPFNILRQTFVIIAIFWGLVYLLVPGGGTPAATLLATYSSALIALVYLLFQMCNAGVISTRLASVAGLIFTLRVIIGVVHYLLFFDRSYFNQSAPTFTYLEDYESLLNLMSAISQHWTEYGFGTFPADFIIQGQKNVILMPYFSLLYYLGGNEHFLNIAVLNSLHNVLVATTVAGLAATLVTRKIVAATFLITLLQPFGMFSSIMWRDSVGQLFLVIGSSLIFQYRGRLLEIGKPILGSLMLMSLRNIYLVVGVLTLFVKLKSQTRGHKDLVYSRVTVLVIFLALSYFYIYDLAITFYSFKETGFVHASSQGSEFAVKKFVIGLVGPFPWTQIFNPLVPGREYLLADVFQAMYNLSVLFMFLQGLVRKNIRWREQPNLTIISLVLMIMSIGLFSYGHVPYVTVATVLLLPLIPGLNALKFFEVFLFFVVANLSLGMIYGAL